MLIARWHAYKIISQLFWIIINKLSAFTKRNRIKGSLLFWMHQLCKRNWVTFCGNFFPEGSCFEEMMIVWVGGREILPLCQQVASVASKNLGPKETRWPAFERKSLSFQLSHLFEYVFFVGPLRARLFRVLFQIRCTNFNSTGQNMSPFHFLTH